MPVNLLDQIRYSCKAVAARSEYIQIDTDRIPHYAESIPIHQAIAPEHDPETHYVLEESEAAVGGAFVGEVILPAFIRDDWFDRFDTQ